MLVADQRLAVEHLLRAARLARCRRIEPHRKRVILTIRVSVREAAPPALAVCRAVTRHGARRDGVTQLRVDVANACALARLVDVAEEAHRGVQRGADRHGGRYGGLERSQHLDAHIIAYRFVLELVGLPVAAHSVPVIRRAIRPLDRRRRRRRRRRRCEPRRERTIGDRRRRRRRRGVREVEPSERGRRRRRRRVLLDDARSVRCDRRVHLEARRRLHRVAVARRRHVPDVLGVRVHDGRRAQARVGARLLANVVGRPHVAGDRAVHPAALAVMRVEEGLVGGRLVDADVEVVWIHGGRGDLPKFDV